VAPDNDLTTRERRCCTLVMVNPVEPSWPSSRAESRLHASANKDRESKTNAALNGDPGLEAQPDPMGLAVLLSNLLGRMGV
jgi:hypothetical protein